MSEKKKKKKENSAKKVTTIKSELKLQKKKAQKKTQKCSKHSVNINGTRAVSVPSWQYYICLHYTYSTPSSVVLGTYESIAGEAAWERRLWGSKSVTGWPCKCWQQQGESEQTVPVAHQPCSFQDFLQVFFFFYRMRPLVNIFNYVTHIFWLVIYSSAFTSETWEKKPILIQRKNPDYYKGLFSTAEFDRILREVIHPLLMSNLIHLMKGMLGLCKSIDHYVLWS